MFSATAKHYRTEMKKAKKMGALQFDPLERKVRISHWLRSVSVLVLIETLWLIVTSFILKKANVWASLMWGIVDKLFDCNVEFQEKFSKIFEA